MSLCAVRSARNPPKDARSTTLVPSRVMQTQTPRRKGWTFDREQAKHAPHQVGPSTRHCIDHRVDRNVPRWSQTVSRVNTHGGHSAKHQHSACKDGDFSGRRTLAGTNFRMPWCALLHGNPVDPGSGKQAFSPTASKKVRTCWGHD